MSDYLLASRRPRRSAWTSAFVGIAATVVSSWLGAAPIKTEHATVELVAQNASVVPGEMTMLGLSIKHAPHWHTYWKNPGDSGYPTKITWAPPFDAVKVVPQFMWPTPKRIATGPIVNFGYDGDVVLPIPMMVPPQLVAGDRLTYTGKAEWLVCKDVCVPEEGDISISLPVVANAAQVRESQHASLFAAATTASPGNAIKWTALLHAPAVTPAGANASREVWLSLKPPAEITPLKSLDIFPETEQISDPSVQDVYKTSDGYAVRLKVADGAKVPETLPLVISGDQVVSLDGRTSGEVKAKVTSAAFSLPAGAVKLTSAGSSSPTAISPGAAAGAGDDMSFLLALGLAFLGGMVLNLMPCVFPVLSLKILSFAQHSGKAAESRTAMRQHGIYYAVGVVLSFLALAGVMLALKSAGSAIGWGFQLQNPGVVWVLAVIFFLIGLNLMGAFEVGQLAPSSLLSMQAKHPGVDAFFSGVLAVIAASPCTAPFMGAALGFALTQSAAAALAVFAALGLGMALPYVLLAWFPKWLDKLPRPGQWMITFKQLLAFPMFLTVVWLVWVISLQAGADGAAIGLLGLVGLAFAAWLIGSMKSGVRWAGVAAAVIAMALAWPASEPAQAATTSAKSSKANWQPWDPAAVAKLNAEGKPVFVDFTAAWCVSCQANKRLVLTRVEIEALFEQKKVTLMRADWTNRDERITQALAGMNRSGVPVYVLHAPGKAPQLLPELLTTGIVKDAIAALP